MSTQTLAELAKRVDEEIVRGVAEDIITINPVFSFIPFMGYAGDGIIVNRENALGDAGLYSVGDTITDKTPSTVTQTTFTATKIIGDAEMDGLVQVQGEGDGVDMLADEISSKSKSVGRTFQAGIATGTGATPEVNSLHSLCDSGQFTTASAGQALSFALMDELCDLVKAKDGAVDWIMMPARTLRAFKALYRALGGTTPTTVLELPNGTTRTVLMYEDIPVFKNEYLSIVETANGAALTGGALTSVWAGVWDDGTRKVGVSAIYPRASSAGIQVQSVGTKEAADEEIWRVKWYTNFASFNRRGLARLTSINN